ncbi:MAG: hypothetical protein HN350_02175 [Phycisphaerales bacterium]|nr:hypothetical protein [Phycisphaerales bacterium]
MVKIGFFKTTSIMLLSVVACVLVSRGAESAGKPDKTYVVILDLACKDSEHGKQLSDSIRLRLARHKNFSVIDRLTTQDFAKPTPADANVKSVISLMQNKLLVTVGVYGTVTVSGAKVTANIVGVNITDPKKPLYWRETFSDSTQRARGIIARAVVEKLTGKPEWKPPEYGDEDEPKKFGKPLNVNGGFDKAHSGWDAPDLAATFLIDGPKERGKVLKILTTANRDQWIAYRRKLRLGQIKPTKNHGVTYKGEPVAALEGVHYRSKWIKAKPGQRYWLTADKKGPGAKIFIKGFMDWSTQATGLPESSLARLGLTPEKFANLPRKKQLELIKTDAKAHPEQYRRQCFQWFLNCESSKKWKHHAAPFPPKGGLANNVQWFQIQIYSYWPPGEYLWDNVQLYKDPRQTKPLPEVNARTKTTKQ